MKKMFHWIRDNQDITTVIVVYGTIGAFMLIGFGLAMYSVIFPSSHYGYDDSYIDKNQTVYEQEYVPKYQKYRVKLYQSVKQSDDTSRWVYEKTIDYGKHKPRIAYLRKVSVDEFAKMVQQ